MMLTAKSHPIWNYFKKSDGGNRTSCNKCCTQIKCPNSGTTNMIQHLQRKHSGLHKLYSEEKEKFDQQKQKTRKRKPHMILNHPKITNFAHAPVFAANDRRQTTVTRAIAEMLAIDMEPFSKVENRGFRNLLIKFEPRYKILSRTTFSRSIIPEMLEREQNRVKEEINSKFTSLALTADIWSSKKQDSYIDITCHFIDENFKNINYLLDKQYFPERHTSDNIIAKIDLVLETYNILIGEKRLIKVTDNGSNFVKALKLVADAVPSLPCFAHTLQLTIREAIAQTSYLSKFLKNGTDIVTFYHRSQPSLENLHASQKKLSLHEKKLVTAIETRWNSEYLKEKRLFEIREPLLLSLSQLKSNIF